MRTTLTLDDDVWASLERMRVERGLSLKELANRALREGLLRLEEPAASRSPFRMPTVNLGPCLIGNLESVGAALAVAEGDDHR